MTQSELAQLRMEISVHKALHKQCEAILIELRRSIPARLQVEYEVVIDELARVR